MTEALLQGFPPPRNGGDGEPCPWCRETMVKPPVGSSRVHSHPHRVSRDHLIPKSRGGGPIVFVCAACNGDKADKTLDQWLIELLADGDPRGAVVAAWMARHARQIDLIRAEEQRLSVFRAHRMVLVQQRLL